MRPKSAKKPGSNGSPQTTMRLPCAASTLRISRTWRRKRLAAPTSSARACCAPCRGRRPRRPPCRTWERGRPCRDRRRDRAGGDRCRDWSESITIRCPSGLVALAQMRVLRVGEHALEVAGRIEAGRQFDMVFRRVGREFQRVGGGDAVAVLADIGMARERKRSPDRERAGSSCSGRVGECRPSTASTV